MVKVRNARRSSENEFELALGEMFVLASDAFKERNGLKAIVQKLIKANGDLIEEVRYWRSKEDV